MPSYHNRRGVVHVDTGTDLRDRVFDPFYRADPTGSSSVEVAEGHLDITVRGPAPPNAGSASTDPSRRPGQRRESRDEPPATSCGWALAAMPLVIESSAPGNSVPRQNVRT